MRIIDRLSAKEILRMIRIPALFTHKKTSLFHIYYFGLKFFEQVPEVASVAKTKRFIACGKGLTQ